MTKYLVRLILAFSILLSSGYSTIYASFDSESTFEDLGNSFGTAVGANSSRQHPLTLSKAKEHGADIFTVNNSKVEEEDDEFVSNKSLLNSDHLNAVHFTQLFNFLFKESSHDLHFSKYIPSTGSVRKHVIIQVFRI
ncbi:hypothetical protein LZF95_06620 [Algoriphagus sp. AGSA1]|uniref:hypothetical protein n=1 Tax=Algoriphagus sp. AGSA1 TaxID=2907213 RepID=UPI001F1CAEC9|nr:hypothetical protein [Algoriphagus sp. AGSA1]MCE7054341.1 hypothetical protein [Algoriphagus sp. AGSA1]